VLEVRTLGPYRTVLKAACLALLLLPWARAGWGGEPPLAVFECRCAGTPPQDTFFNARLACKALHGLVLTRGETLSFNRLMAKVRRYFKPGLTVSGNSTTLTQGGGICQVATALYHAALLAGLEVKESHRHSAFLPVIDYCKEGEDAAVSLPAKDLKIKNSRSCAVRCQAYTTDGKAVILKIFDCGANKL